MNATSLSRAAMRGASAESAELAHLLSGAIDGEVRFDGWSRMLYSTTPTGCTW